MAGFLLHNCPVPLSCREAGQTSNRAAAAGAPLGSNLSGRMIFGECTHAQISRWFPGSHRTFHACCGVGEFLEHVRFRRQSVRQRQPVRLDRRSRESGHRRNAHSCPAVFAGAFPERRQLLRAVVERVAGLGAPGHDRRFDRQKLDFRSAGGDKLCRRWRAFALSPLRCADGGC